MRQELIDVKGRYDPDVPSIKGDKEYLLISKKTIFGEEIALERAERGLCEGYFLLTLSGRPPYYYCVAFVNKTPK